MTDPIADMLTRIRNAQALSRKEVFVPASRVKKELARILKEEGYISDIKDSKDRKEIPGIMIGLKYDHNDNGVIKNIQRVSKPGQRIYAKSDKLPRILQGIGIAVVSTSQGLMTDHKARARKLGGEIICKVW